MRFTDLSVVFYYTANSNPLVLGKSLFESNYSFKKIPKYFYSTFIQPLFQYRIINMKKKPYQTAEKRLSDAVFALVEITGLEPVTSWLPVKHSPSWAIPPWDNILFCLNRAAVLTAALLVEIRYVWNCKTFHLAWWVQRWKNSIICSLPKNSPPDCFLNGRLRIPGKMGGFFG